MSVQCFTVIIEKRELQCIICGDTDGPMEAIPCDESNRYLVDKIFRCTNVKVTPVDGFLSAFCESCKFRIDHFVESTDATHVASGVKVESETGHLGSLRDSFVSNTVVAQTSTTAPLNKESLESIIDIEEVKLEPVDDDDDRKQEAVDDDAAFKPYRCFVCWKEFTHVQQLNRHRKQHTEQKNYCLLCPASFVLRGDLKIHREYSHGLKNTRVKLNTRCIACGKDVLEEAAFPYDETDQRLKESVRRRARSKVQPEDGYISCFCKRCYLRTRNPSSQQLFDKSALRKTLFSKKLARAQLQSAFRNPYRCAVCLTSCGSSNSLKRHLQLHLRVRHACKVCSRSFISDKSLKNHQQKLHDIVAGDSLPTDELQNAVADCVICGGSDGSMESMACKSTDSALLEKIFQCTGIKIKPVGGFLPNVCEICRYRIEHFKALYKCDQCPQMYKQSLGLAQHVLMSHGKNISTGYVINTEVARKQLAGEICKPFRCEVCSKVFNVKHILRTHLRLHMENVNIFECDQCILKFSTQLKLNRHKRSEHAGDPSSKQTLQREQAAQQLKETLMAPFRCKACPKVYSCSYDLKKHLQGHIDITTYKCNLCPRIYTIKSSLVKHTKTVHLSAENSTGANEDSNERTPISKPIVASRNSRNIIINPTVASRQLTSKLKRPYRCEVCSNCYSRPASLIEHLKRHMGPNYVHVPRRTEPAINSEVAFRQLENVASDSPPYRCETCSQTYKNKYQFIPHLKRHMAPEYVQRCQTRHNPEAASRQLAGELTKPYRCNVCSKVSATKDTLIAHLQLHMGSKLRCPRCPRLFSTLFYYNRHIKVDHGVSESEADGTEEWNKNAEKASEQLKCSLDAPPYECNVCHGKFASTSGLRKHLNQYLKCVKTFKCDKCQRPFANHGNVLRHLKKNQCSSAKCRQEP